MNRFILVTLVAFLFSRLACTQVIQDGNCTVDSEFWSLPQCALEIHSGELYVARAYLPLFFSSAGKALQYGSSENLAWTHLPQDGWAYFDRTGLVVVRNVATMDNAPNAFHYGLVRVTKDKKWGLADMHGRVIVPFAYDGMLDYREGTGWPACTGCKYVQQGEYGSFHSGKWISLDRHGKALSMTSDLSRAHHNSPHN
jgi:hypothetical protein